MAMCWIRCVGSFPVLVLVGMEVDSPGRRSILVDGRETAHSKPRPYKPLSAAQYRKSAITEVPRERLSNRFSQS